MAQYGSTPAGPAPTAPPPSTQLAVKLIWVGIALAVLSAILQAILIDDIVDQLRDSDTGLSEDAARTAAYVGLAFGLVIGVAISATLAYFISKGHNWARIVYTVLAVLGILFSLRGLANQPALLLVVSLISLALTIAVVVLLFRSDSNAYFKKSRFADGT